MLWPKFLKVFGCLEHTNNCFIFFRYRGQNDRNETKLTFNRGFRWIARSISNDSIRRPGFLADLDSPIFGPPVQIRRWIWTPPSPNPLANMDPPGPNPLADMDPPSPDPLADLNPLREFGPPQQN